MCIADGRRCASGSLLAVELIEDVQTEIEEVTELGDERLVIGVVRSGRGMGSGLTMEFRDWWALWFADGLVTRRQAFWTKDEALEAAGIEE